MRVRPSKWIFLFSILEDLWGGCERADSGAISAQYVIDGELLTHVVRVTRPIEKGEEITISCKFPTSSLHCLLSPLTRDRYFTA